MTHVVRLWAGLALLALLGGLASGCGGEPTARDLYDQFRAAYDAGDIEVMLAMISEAGQDNLAKQYGDGDAATGLKAQLATPFWKAVWEAEDPADVIKSAEMTPLSQAETNPDAGVGKILFSVGIPKLDDQGNPIMVENARKQMVALIERRVDKSMPIRYEDGEWRFFWP